MTVAAKVTKPAAPPRREILEVAERLAVLVDDLLAIRQRLGWGRDERAREEVGEECTRLEAGYLLVAALEEVEFSLTSGCSSSGEREQLQRQVAVLREVVAMVRAREAEATA